jgi:hypothetical protein
MQPLTANYKLRTINYKLGFIPKFYVTKDYISVCVSIRFLIGLPAPCPALESIQINVGVFVSLSSPWHTMKGLLLLFCRIQNVPFFLNIVLSSQKVKTTLKSQSK